MIMWQGYHMEGKFIFIIECSYNPKTQKYTMIITKNGKRDSATLEESFVAQEEPKDELMNIKDVERSVKTANNLIKKLDKFRLSMEINNV